MFPPFVTIPLVTGFLYAVASVLLKRALHPGSDSWRNIFVVNWVCALVVFPLALMHRGPVAWENLWHAGVPAATFFCGQVFTFLALQRGDVSVATPVLGSKVLFVAGFSVLLMPERVPLRWWAAAFLTVLAAVLLAGGKHRGSNRHRWEGIAYGFAAAACFALSDVLVQMWGEAAGPLLFVPLLFLGVAVLSLGVIPLFRPSDPAVAANVRPWLLGGAAILGLQAALMGYTLARFGHATVVNVVYGSRGLWTILLVWTIGHWIGNTERQLGHAVMVRRAFGSLLLLAAIWLVI